MSMEFSVASPVGQLAPTVKRQRTAPRLSDLKGKTVCEVWNGMFRGDVLFPAIRELLKKRYPGVKIIPYDEFPTMPHSFAEMAKIQESIKQAVPQKGCDAVITGVGG